jgi:hypothetical protein
MRHGWTSRTSCCAIWCMQPCTNSDECYSHACSRDSCALVPAATCPSRVQ